MQYVSILEQVTKEAIREFAEKRNLVEHFSESYIHPQEDFLMTSDTPPIFVVADGVTLNFKKLIEDKAPYPNPSPAGEVAKIFCEAVQKSASNNYQDFDEDKIQSVFWDANDAVAKYNERVGKSDVSGNVTGFYSATGSFVIIKDNKAYWASICDAFFAHFDKDMNLKFMSSGTCIPYAVINGEEKMAEHLERGVIELQKGDRVLVFTDGFEHYVKNSEFLNILKNWSDDLKDRIKEFSEKMNIENPANYGHERSLIVLSI